jgi:hypothetical protein
LVAKNITCSENYRSNRNQFFEAIKEVEEAKVDSSPDDAIEELLLSSIAVLLLLPSLGLIVVPLIIMAADSGVVIVGISLQLKSEFLLLF